MGRKNAWFSHLRMCEIFTEIWGTVLFFRVMAICSDCDNEFSSALVLHIIYTDEGYSDWKPGRNDHVKIFYFLLRDAVW